MQQSRQTRLLSVPDVRQLIHRVGLGPFFVLLADRIQADFVRWPEFLKCPRTANHSPEGVIELMPASDGEFYSFKYVNGHPNNYVYGLPTVMAFGSLAEVNTGFPLLISEMTLLTAIRTAATSAVAARALANEGAKCMAVIGNGAQSEFQILAFRELLGVNSVQLYDIDPQATQKLTSNLSGINGLELMVHSSVTSAVGGCDIVTTSTAAKVHASVLTPELLEPGMHINAIGGDCPGKTEISPEVLNRVTVFVEFEAQTRIEGEIQQMSPSFPVKDLWRVVSGEIPGRASADEITLFDSVGFSIEDYSTLRLVHELAEKHGIGSKIDLIPNLPDFRDLYSALK